MILWLELPWERARALRLLNLQTALELALAWPPKPYGGQLDPESERFWRELLPLLNRPAVTELLYVLREEMTLSPIAYTWEGTESLLPRSFRTLAERVLSVETARNATRVILALEAWKHDHRGLPKRLEELVGPYLDRLPLDPCSGEPFHYLPGGLNTPLRWGRSPLGWSAKAVIPANTPLVWSIGTDVRKAGAPPTEDVTDRYEIRAYPGDGWHHAMSECDVWQSGWPFPIP